MAKHSWMLVALLGLCAPMLVCSEDFTFWQISDTHSDWLYQANVTPQQGVCRAGTKGDSGYFGDYLCDPPLITQSEAIQEMKRLAPNPKFILNTGDSFPHASGKIEDVYKSVANTTHELKSHFPKVPIIYAVGNHDVYPCHCVLPNSDTLAKLADAIKDILSAD